MEDRKEEGRKRMMTPTAGLMNPTVLFPAASRASFTAAITAANMGADADVPPECTKPPPSAMTRGHLYIHSTSAFYYYLLSPSFSFPSFRTGMGGETGTYPLAATSGYALPDLLKTDAA
jgi:hypothetical protein